MNMLLASVMSRRRQGLLILQKLDNTIQDPSVHATFSVKSHTETMVTSSLELLACDKVAAGGTTEKPLAVILSWLMSKKKAERKYADFYIGQGFDVLITRVTPYQMMWPVTGSQLVAKELISFLSKNSFYSPVVLHGFSAGGYLWGEAMVIMKLNLDMYRPVIDRIAAQIWDSVGSVEEIKIGIPDAVFPENRLLRTISASCIKYHMERNYDTATRHYHNAYDLFLKQPLVRSPALFFVSKTDPVGTLAVTQEIHNCWESIGVQSRIKCWDASPHVDHFRKHPEEYVEEWRNHLAKCGLLRSPQNFKAKL